MVRQKGNSMVTTNNIFNNEMFQNKGLKSYKPFGLNVRVPEKTLEQISETVKAAASSNITPVLAYFATNEDVFSGKVEKEIDSLTKQSQITSSLLDDSEMARPKKFEMHM